MFKEKKKKRLAELSVFGIQVKDKQDSANGRHFHLRPPLHSTLFAVVASHRKEDCFTPYWQSVSEAFGVK